MINGGVKVLRNGLMLPSKPLEAITNRIYQLIWDFTISRLEEARLAQEALAKANGIHGFCYYHYWFNGEFWRNL
jgi:hypothetical protein